MSGPRTLLGAVGLLAVLAVAACGSSSSHSSGSSVAHTPAAGSSSSSATAAPTASTSTVLSPPGAKGVAAKGVTSARVCTFLTTGMVKQLLGGAAPSGPGRPDTRYGGQATCVWAAGGGSNVSLTITRDTGLVGCNGQPGVVVHGTGWTGCYHPNQGLVGVGGAYSASVQPDLGTAAPPSNLETAEETAITQAFKGLAA